MFKTRMALVLLILRAFMDESNVWTILSVSAVHIWKAKTFRVVSPRMSVVRTRSRFLSPSWKRRLRQDDGGREHLVRLRAVVKGMMRVSLGHRRRMMMTRRRMSDL